MRKINHFFGFPLLMQKLFSKWNQITHSLKKGAEKSVCNVKHFPIFCEKVAFALLIVMFNIELLFQSAMTFQPSTSYRRRLMPHQHHSQLWPRFQECLNRPCLYPPRQQVIIKGALCYSWSSSLNVFLQQISSYWYYISAFSFINFTKKILWHVN